MYYIFTEKELNPVFDILESCRDIGQNTDRHPEGDVFMHLLQSMHFAFNETDDIDLIIAAIFHDIGKTIDTKKHPEIGAEILTKYHLSEKTIWLVANHMLFMDYIEGNDEKHINLDLKVLPHQPYYIELTILARIDKMAREKNLIIPFNRQEILNNLNSLGKNKSPLTKYICEPTASLIMQT